MSYPQEPGGQGQPSDQPYSADETVTRQHPQASQPDPAQPAGYPMTPQAPPPGFPMASPPGFPMESPPGFPMAPQAPPPGLPGEPILVSIGDISVTQSTVYTPSGARPLGEVSWSVSDMSVTSQVIPTWAIVCAVLFFVFCFLGLLFLLAKEVTTTGTIQVTVSGPGFVYTSSIPVSSPAQVADINARVNYVRTVTAAIPPTPYGPNDQPPATGTGQEPGRAW